MQAEQNINQEGFGAQQDKSIPGSILLGTRLFCHNTAMAVKRHLPQMPQICLSQSEQCVVDGIDPQGPLCCLNLAPAASSSELLSSREIILV